MAAMGLRIGQFLRTAIFPVIGASDDGDRLLQPLDHVHRRIGERA